MNSLVIIDEFSINILQNILSTNHNFPIYFLSDTKNVFESHITIENSLFNCDENFEKEIENFNESTQFIFKNKSELLFGSIVESIKSVIAAYLIKQGYVKLKKQVLNDFSLKFDKNLSKQKWNENDYIVLRNIGFGSSFIVELIYLIEKDELYALKKLYSYINEEEKLIEREIKNYLSIDYPLLPKLYGTANNKKFMIVQFINGKTLDNISQLELSFKQKITIIFELIMIVNYLHKNGFIYRDLKPNNIIIDENMNSFIIDFDRMIKYSDIINDKNYTQDFSSYYADPEMISGVISYKNDIYSLGKIICFMMNNKMSELNKDQESKVNEICEKCTSKSINNRPSAIQLMYYYLRKFSSEIDISLFQNDPIVKHIFGLVNHEKKYIYLDNNVTLECYQFAADQNDPEAQYELGLIYYEGELVARDINKSIYYYTLSSNQNDQYSQEELGFIYYTGQYVKRNINKAIKLFQYSAIQGNQNSQYYLGIIYYEGKYINQDINEAIHYLSLSANQNDPDAQFFLGTIYHEGKYVLQDINKFIYYYKLAAKQNHLDAQFELAVIYYEGAYVERDINKATYYFTNIANENDPESQYYLGIIYYEGEFTKMDINKSIYYLKLASDQNYLDAQFKLGIIYYEGKYVERDIDKSIHYFTLAANQNYTNAQFELGMIYCEGKYVSQDIDKAIYFYTLAADQNHLEAQYNLGFIYCYKDPFISIALSYAQFLPQVINSNHPKAQFIPDLFYFNKDNYPHDINKAIHYFSLIVEKNNINYISAQLILSLLYFSEVDVFKSYEYLNQAANQSHPDAQFFLACLLYEANRTQSFNMALLASKQNHSIASIFLGFFYESEKNIDEAIHYFSLSINQGNQYAHYFLGKIFLIEDYKQFNIDKSIYHLTIAASKNIHDAAYILGVIFYQYKKDSKTAFTYFQIAAKQNHPYSQSILGDSYLNTNSFSDMMKSADFFIQSSLNNCTYSFFYTGYFYHEGKYICRDINKCIYYYKEASTYNNFYAKNNLGIIYKNGIEGKIPKNCSFAIEYFDETIRRSNDKVSMYNLAHLYFYEDKSKVSIQLAIELLNKSINQQFHPSEILLDIVYFIQNKINNNEIKSSTNEIVFDNSLEIDRKYEKLYQEYKTIDYLYNYKCKPIESKSLFQQNNVQQKNTNLKNITNDFFDGFGYDI